jgi:hypothetical protein
MSYTINLTNGTIFAVIPDGTINTSSSMTLIGKNYAGYGQFLDDNYIHLLENSSNSTPPGAPLTGQLWWDSGTGLLKVYNGSAFKIISSTTAQSSAPTNPVTGDLWFDTTNQQLKVWNGSTWLVVGPSSTTPGGTTGAVATAIVDNVAVTHYVIELYAAGGIVGIVSQDATFTPATPISGFPTISPGIQLATTVNSQTPVFWGTANNASYLGGIPASSYLTSISSSFTGAITLNTGGAATTALINGATPGVGNIGSNAVPFNTIFATATSAQYADVAERFAADDVYAPGTVVELGGVEEITVSNTELSEFVFGVISTNAAYLMNSGAGSNDTHPPVAMTGRVPVRVIGQVNKGDRLVSAGNGLARAAQPGEATSFNVIGRALTSKTGANEGTVEAIVTVK